MGTKVVKLMKKNKKLREKLRDELGIELSDSEGLPIKKKLKDTDNPSTGGLTSRMSTVEQFMSNNLYWEDPELLKKLDRVFKPTFTAGGASKQKSREKVPSSNKRKESS
jgi:hypothetical protein